MYMFVYDLKGFIIAEKNIYYVHELYMYIHCSVLKHIPVHSATSFLTIYICKFMR